MMVPAPLAYERHVLMQYYVKVFQNCGIANAAGIQGHLDTLLLHLRGLPRVGSRWREIGIDTNHRVRG
jgi:hypothetical protein